MAYHEIGHALVAAKQTNSAPVQKITIVPRTSGALGYTMQVDEGNHVLMSKEEIENKIATFTGGRAAEEVVFGSVTTGASNDIEQATKLARPPVKVAILFSISSLPVSYTHLLRRRLPASYSSTRSTPSAKSVTVRSAEMTNGSRP